MNVFENAIKGPVTTLFGIIMMACSYGGWMVGYLNNIEAPVSGGIGVLLVLSKDTIIDAIGKFLKKKLE